MSRIKNARIKKLFENLDAGKTNYDKENQCPCQEVRKIESFTTNQNEDWLENNEEKNWEVSDTTVQSPQKKQGNIVPIPSTEFFNIPAPNKACLQVNIEEEIRSSQNYPAVLTPLKNVQLNQYENQCFPDTRSDISHICATYKDVSETAFQFDIDKPSTSASIPRNMSRKNYEITPIDSDESDADLSDNDPTYTLCGNSSQMMQPKSNRRSSSSDSNSSSSSSTSSLSSSNSSSSSDNVKSDMHEDQESNDSMVSRFPASTATSNVEENGENGMEQHIRSRKRSRHPSQWKQNSATLKRNLGQAYVSSNKEILAGEVKPPCSSKCRLKCNDKLVAAERLQLFETFWGLGNINLQRSFIASCLVQVVPKYKYSNVEKPRNSNQAFFFHIEHKKKDYAKYFS